MRGERSGSSRPESVSMANPGEQAPTQARVFVERECDVLASGPLSWLGNCFRRRDWCMSSERYPTPVHHVQDVSRGLKAMNARGSSWQKQRGARRAWIASRVRQADC